MKGTAKVFLMGGGGGEGSGDARITPAMYLIKTSLDVTINGIFKGDVIDVFAPAIYLIKPSQSAVTIDGSKTLVYI